MSTTQNMCVCDLTCSTVTFTVIFLLSLVGHSSTHAVVPARLITLGKDHGMHLFIVQLRSLEDHTPLPGSSLTLHKHIFHLDIFSGQV